MSRLLALRARVRFALWVARTRAQLARHGMRLVVEGAARFDGAPHLYVAPQHGRGGSLTLRLAEGVRLGRGLQLQVESGRDSVLDLGDGVYFQNGVRIELGGGTITLARHCHVRDNAVLRSSGLLTFGEEVSISWRVVITCAGRVEFADFSGIGENSSVHDSNHPHDGTDDFFLRNPLVIDPIHIGRNTVLSSNVIVLAGTRLGKNSMVGAGALLLRGEYPDSHLIAGRPAKAVRPLR